MFIPCSPTKSNNMSAQKTNNLKNFKYICTYLEEDKNNGRHEDSILEFLLKSKKRKMLSKI